ncbi:class I SAM-dependent methyltransferase [Brevibacterium sediminis]|uniref:Class I SAM-dependent methyltransferase n=1 Tax=Brevibacterium sediminis TaxID=1857024 RepID=A0A5C4X683_9MICO|nr:class I SAM-dependent methyltransferase [Brevibacterium sediminis]MCS4593899.1 class I SAM-dependent methyltransferase [Brevibacterium sediminis]TNM56788.1 class I SAM-dependent methyltransferase [Brevibacterium sediminis]
MEHFENRERAESFGEVARDYDAFRPKYPAALLSAIIQAAGASADSQTDSSLPSTSDRTADAPRILDVGSGTGILASQLRSAGAEILAIEPDPAMAAVARAKGLDVEVSAFEKWDPQGRTFDLVSFGQSFHWVDPLVALPKVRTVLRPGGILALAWNDIEPISELKTRLDAVIARFHADGRTASLGSRASRGTEASQEARAGSGTAESAREVEPVEHPALTKLQDAGFTPNETTFVEDLHYSRHDWLSMVFTYSAQLTMDPVKRAVMREEMAAEIPDDGLDARNEALLVLAGA